VEIVENLGMSQRWIPCFRWTHYKAPRRSCEGFWDTLRTGTCGLDFWWVAR